MLCACGSSSADLSDEDTEKVVNYSSDVLSKHNQASSERIADESEVKSEYQKQLDLDVKKQNILAQEQASQSASGSEDQSVSGDAAVPSMSLAEAVGVPGFEIDYKGYDISQSYPESVSEDIYMGMTAAEKDKLLILHFTITNTSDTDAECNILSQKPTFRVKLNGEKNTVQQTILEDDMISYDDTVPAGQSVPVVLISEIASDKLNDIQSLSLIVRSAEGRPEYQLEQ